MTSLNPKQAAAIAKAYVGDLFSDEGVFDVQLEEVDFDNGKGDWLVTISFRRSGAEELSPLAKALENVRPRSFKVVRIADRTGDVASVFDRRLSAA